MAVETTWVGYGEPAMAALEDALATLRAGDPLAAVTVVTPSPAVAVLTRRAVARRLGGCAGVSFQSLGALAELVAASGLAAAGIEVGVDRELVVAGVRRVLRQAPGRLGPIRHHRSTWEAVAATIVELDGLDDEARARIATAGDLPAEMARLHRAVTELVGPVGGPAVLRLATDAVRERGLPADVGPIVVHLPARLAALEVEFLAALGEAAPVRLLLGSAGRHGDDSAVATELAALGVPEPSAELPSPVPTRVVSANDVDDEVRAAVRRILSLADGGVPLHRMAIVHPAGSPYARVVDDVLASAGVPFSAPSSRTLAQTAPGRTLSSMLSVVRSGFGRQEVVDLWASGVLVDADGRPVPSALFDETSRRLGVIRGFDRWMGALDTSDARLEARLDAGDDDSGVPDDGLAAWVAGHRATNARIRQSLGTLGDLASSAPDRWTDVAGWCERVLDVLCGPVTRRSWPDHELDAETAIVTAVGRLVSLARVEDAPGRDIVFDTIATLLDAPAPRASRTGTGLLVTTIDRPPVVPLDAVAVVGLVEGLAPNVPADDVLLGDQLRHDVGMVGVEGRQRDQRRAFDAALASARDHRLLTFARNDQRSGRTLVPSRWVVDAVESATGHRPDTEHLMAGIPVEGVETVDSHSAGLEAVAAGATAALHREERTMADLVAAGGLDGHPAASEPAIAAGTELVRARQSDDFTRFDGNLGGDGVDVTAMGVLSPTSLETYAACPRRWFFAHALRLRTTERPEEIDRLPPREKGTLVHLVLERFFAERIEADEVPAPGRPWPGEAVARLHAIAAEECDDLEARGLTGHPRWWEHDKDEIRVALSRALQRDVEVRSRFGTLPVAVEFHFGRDGQPPLQVDLGDGRVIALAGSADRIDVGGGVVQVWDYKYSRSTGFEDLVKDPDKGGDPLLAGTKLQLVAYGMAADEAYGQPEVHAAYWFVRPDAAESVIGYPITDELRDRFRRVLTVLADGIGEGRFPARPGAFQWHWGTYEHCGWCDFDDICPRDRDEEWERVRFDPSLHRLGRLADEGSVSVLDQTATEAS